MNLSKRIPVFYRHLKLGNMSNTLVFHNLAYCCEVSILYLNGFGLVFVITHPLARYV